MKQTIKRTDNNGCVVKMRLILPGSIKDSLMCNYTRSSALRIAQLT